MGKEEKEGFKADIPSDALADALKSVEKYSDKIASEQTGDYSSATTVEEKQEEPVVRVEIEPEVDESLDSDEFASLKTELEKAREEAADLKNKMYRIAADADNIRKRALKEREEGLRFGQEGLLRDLLPVVDNLERTLDHVPEQTDDPAFVSLRQGVEMVLKHFISILEGHGVKAFDSKGEMFDPKLHEALSRKESSEAQPGTILKELHKGFMLHDRLLRPALVEVACLPEKDSEQSDDACDEVSEAEETTGEETEQSLDEETESSYDEQDG